MGVSTHARLARLGRSARREDPRAGPSVPGMDTTDIETVVIGAGRAGLATGHHLQRRGRPFVILDANTRVGER